MARRWLLTLLTGTALTIGLGSAASAQELLGEPLAVGTQIVTATVSADAAEQSLAVTLETDAVAEELDTEVAPTVTAEVTPEGPTLDVEGPATVGGNELPIPQVVAPVEEVVERPAEAAPTQDQAAAGGGVSAAPAPVAGPAPVAEAPRGTVEHSSTVTADRAAYRSGLRADTTTMALEEADALAPAVAPPAGTLPLVAASAPTIATDLALPIIDSTPTVPALLRLLAGLLVVGAAATWRTVRQELA